jgi:hypothetical protein
VRDRHGVDASDLFRTRAGMHLAVGVAAPGCAWKIPAELCYE